MEKLFLSGGKESAFSSNSDGREGGRGARIEQMGGRTARIYEFAGSALLATTVGAYPSISGASRSQAPRI